MSHGDFSFYEVMRWLPPVSPQRVLDAGCGAGELALYLRTFPGRSFSHLASGPSHLIGYDINVENIERLRPLGLYDQLIRDDLINLKNHVAQVGLSVCLETLEHIKKPRAREILGSLVDISDKVLVIVPYGWSLNESEDQEMIHRSPWWPEDFRAFGLDTHVVDAVAPLLPRPVRAIYKTYMKVRGWLRKGDGRRIIALNYDPKIWF
jgi:SAM-dependent methyltransferase